MYTGMDGGMLGAIFADRLPGALSSTNMAEPALQLRLTFKSMLETTSDFFWEQPSQHWAFVFIRNISMWLKSAPCSRVVT